MAKRAGKAYTIPEMEELGYTGRDIRFLVLKQHYRAPIPFTLDLMDEAKKARGVFNNFVSFEMADRPDGDDQPAIAGAIEETKTAFDSALRDDLNTAAAVAAMHAFMTTVNRLKPGRADAERVVSFMRELDHVFGFLDDTSDGGIDAEVEELIRQRDAARAAKDWAESDRIRDELNARGIEIVDTPQGTRVK